MENWKLPSQLVITDNSGNESPQEMFLRHETLRRVTAEGDLIDALDLINDLQFISDTSTEVFNKVEAFLNKFRDKTINN